MYSAVYHKQSAHMRDVAQFMAVSRRHNSRRAETLTRKESDTGSIFSWSLGKQGLILQGLLDSTSLIMIVCSTPRLRLAGGCCSGGGGEGTDFSVPLNSPTHFPFRVPLRPSRSRVTTQRERERDPHSAPSLSLSLFLFVRECPPRCGCLPRSLARVLPPSSHSTSSRRSR